MAAVRMNLGSIEKEQDSRMLNPAEAGDECAPRRKPPAAVQRKKDHDRAIEEASANVCSSLSVTR
jgi:hypothetical protein